MTTAKFKNKLTQIANAPRLITNSGHLPDVFSHCTLSLTGLNKLSLLSPHTSENRVGIFSDRNGNRGSIYQN
jgi:hypothetical protein